MEESCKQHLPEKYLKNRVILFLRELLEHYYAGKYHLFFNDRLLFYRILQVRRAVLQHENATDFSQLEMY